MKKNIFLFLYVLAFTGCWLKPIEKPQLFPTEVSKDTAKQVEMKAVLQAQESVPMAVKEVKGYFLKNSAELSDGINFFVLPSEKFFDEALGLSAIESDVSPKPDFKTKIAVLLSSNRSPQSYDIKISRAYAIGNDIYIEYEFAQSPQELSYYALSSKVFEIEKPQVAVNICFIDSNKNAKVFPLGNRSKYSPASVDDMIKYYTGTYKGFLPAADGPGISTVLVLSKDYTFNLKEIYLSNPDRVFETSGRWAPTSDLSSFVLNYDKPREERSAFRFIDKSTVEKLDIYSETIDSAFYKLRK